MDEGRLPSYQIKIFFIYTICILVILISFYHTNENDVTIIVINSILKSRLNIFTTTWDVLKTSKSVTTDNML